MNGKQIALGIVLADFVALLGYALYSYGVAGFLALEVGNAVAVASTADLTIALTMVAVWIWRDATKRGISPIPYVVLTAVLGSVGPLVYLIRTLGAEAEQRIAMPARSVA